MKQVIYVDVLIAVNLFINYFLIAATAKFLSLKNSKLGLFFGELLGGIYSLYILLPPTNLFIDFAVKFIMSATIIAATFKFTSLKTFFKTLICFLLINFAFSGIMLALWCTLQPKNMQVNNGVVYFNISPVILIASTVITYIILKLTNRIVGKRSFGKSSCEVKIFNENKTAILTAMIDTGNSLTEPFSGLPVIVVKHKNVEGICPKEFPRSNITSVTDETLLLKSKFRMIPFKTISGEGLLPAFRPEYITVNNGTQKNAYIAVCADETLSENCIAILNSDLID